MAVTVEEAEHASIMIKRRRADDDEDDEPALRPLAVRVGERFRFPTPMGAVGIARPSNTKNLCRLVDACRRIAH